MTESAIRVWDWPVRLCHWSMALAILALWWTAENGEMGWHMRVGVFLLFVLAFRIVWGLLGTRTARFASFVKGPIGIWRYVTGRTGHDGVGHNPLGALSVIALLGILLTQVTLGLFAGDPFDGATGPLNDKVGVMTADWMTDWHETLFDGIQALVTLHIAAIAYFWIAKRNNLVSPMLTGNRELPNEQAEGIESASLLNLVICLGLACGLATWVQLGAPLP
ncbi:cytochrome b/b6 domain-containing protein [Altererythrobacter lutimaris]|uniref:Cytochrome b/b6 domain-containing protein n=1 Tax=Altererythrobacter lutimaris TaxID=2743979 RepID=A0A850HDZ0_9SPHN|nr:cytochrome b/b6 domain-containing protein [Altererythrobacter lutimaris]